MPPSSRSHQDYTIGWICAVEPELIAAIAMLDEKHHDKLPAVDGDSNSYTLGSIGEHNVVIASLPSGTYGTNAAATVANQMSRSFQSLQVRLFVGIAGGVPRLAGDDPADIRLGDVVVSHPTYHTGGVIQYDLGKTNEGKQQIERIGTLNKPPTSIQTAVANLKANHRFKKDYPLQDHLALMMQQHSHLAPEYAYQGEEHDILFEAGYKHEGSGPNCANCLESNSVPRSPRPQPSHPHIHYGTIASANQVVKDSVTRDYWRDKEGVLCFEMEAAGLMDIFPCLVIRGICDYADSHKNQRWQPFAAATAAAYAKDLLCTIAPSAVQATDLPFGGKPESGNVHWMVPRNTNTLFTGRQNILEKLNRNLGLQSNSSQTSEQQKRFVIVGDGGIGKSEVCLKFANDYRQQFCGIFWIDASSEETAKQAFVDIGKQCEANAENFEQVKTWLANTRHSWLLIIDNADNHENDYAAFFPSGNDGNIILTTRNPLCRDLATVGSVDLDYLDLQHATSLLFQAAAIAVSSREEKQKAAEAVVQILGFHTLAIIQAGAFVKLHRCPLERYPDIFKTQEEQILKYCRTQEQSTYGSVYATFEISAAHLRSSPEQSAADALDLLGILGFVHYQEIPDLMFSRARVEAIYIRQKVEREGPLREIHNLSELQISRLPRFMMLEDGISVDLFRWRWREVLNLLESYSLIKIGGSSDDLSFSMHPLAHTWTRIRHGIASQKEGWRVAGSIIALSMCGANYDVFHERLRSHVGAYLTYPLRDYTGEATELKICQTHCRICWLLLQLRDIPILRWLLNTLETFKTWTDVRGLSSIRVKTLIAECLIGEDQPRVAVELLEPLVGIEKPDDLTNLYMQGALANAYRSSGQHQKAVHLLEYIVEIRENREGLESEDTIWAQHELGNANFRNGQFERAAPLLEQVVHIRRRKLDRAHLNRLTSEYQLGRAYIETNQFEKAADILQQVLDIGCTILDVTDERLSDTQHELGRAYMGMGKDHRRKAAELLEKVVRIREKSLKPDDQDLLASQYNLALAYIGMESDYYERAAELLEKVVEVYQRTLAHDHSYLLWSQYHLARAYMGMRSGNCERAAELLEKVIKVLKKTLAPDHPDRWLSQQLLEEVQTRINTEEDVESTSVSGETD